LPLENDQTWLIKKSEPGPDLKLFQARFDHATNPRNGITERKIILTGGEAVNVVAITPKREIVLVRQYRFGVSNFTLELPGGLIDPEETPEEAAARELQEETGFTVAGELLYLGKIAQNPVFMDSYIHHFLALNAQKSNSQTLDSGENIEVVTMQLEELKGLWEKGALVHPHSVNGLLRFFNSEYY